MRPTPLHAIALVSALAIAAALLAASSASATVAAPSGLVVAGDVAYRSVDMELTGQVTVLSGGSLELDRVVLTLAPDARGVARLVVEPGGSLTVRDSTITAASGLRSQAISIEIRGDAQISGSTIHGLAGTAQPSLPITLANGFQVPPSGLVLASSSVIVQDTVVSEAEGCGLLLLGSSARLDHVTLKKIRPAVLQGGSFAAGVCVQGGGPSLSGLDLRGAFALPRPASGGPMVAGVAAYGAKGLSLRAIDARGMMAPGSAEPSWSAAVLLDGVEGASIAGGQISNGQSGVVALNTEGPAPLAISALTIRVMSDTPIDISGTYTVATPFAFDNLTIDICAANGVNFLSQSSTAQVTIRLDNVTVTNCAQIGVYIHVLSTTSGSIHDITVMSCTASFNGQEGFFVRGENVQAAVSPVVAWSRASNNGYTGFSVWNNYPSGSTAISAARFDFNTAINNSRVVSGNDGGFWLDLGSPNTLALRYNNNTAIGNQPLNPGAGTYWGHRISVAVRSSMVISPDTWMSGNVAIENGRYGFYLTGGAGASSRFDLAKMRESTIQAHQVGIRAENARVEVWTSYMSNIQAVDGAQTDFILAGTVHNRLTGSTTGIRTIQSYKAIDITALWQNDRPVANTSLRFINGSGSAASVYSTLTPLTGATNLITNAQGRWTGWVLDWVFDPNLPAAQQNRLNFAPITIAVQPQADESRSDPFSLDENIVGPVTFKDEISPVIIVQTPRDNGVYTTNLLNVSGIVTDSISGVAVLQISTDGGNWTDVNRSGGLFNYALAGLSEGTFDLYLRAWDKANDGLPNANITLVILFSIRIDTQPPSLELLLPKLIDGDVYYTNDQVMVFQGAVDSSIQSLFLNGVPIIPTGSYFSVASNLTTEGPQTFVFLALDAAGNTRQITVTVVRDTFNPTLIITSPAISGDIHVSSHFIELRGITDGNTNISVAGINYTVTNQTFVIPVSLVEGLNTVRIQAEDAAGNRAERVIIVHADTQAPVVTIESLSDGDFLNSTRVLVTGTVDEPVSYVTIGPFVVPVVDGIFTATIGLQEQGNLLVVRATDLAGNVGTASVTVTVDTVDPMITFLGLPDRLSVSNVILAVHGSLSEPAVITMNGVDLDMTGMDFDGQVNLAEGENTLTFRAVDGAGNVGIQVRTVVLDTQAPPITILRPANQGVVHDALVLIEGTTEPFATVTVGGHQVAADEDGAFSAYVELPSTGPNMVVVQVRDAAGNDASKSIEVNLEAVSQDTLTPLLTSGVIAAALAAGLAFAGLFMARKVVSKKVKVFEASKPTPAPPTARAPRPPRPPAGAPPPRPPRPPSN